MTNFPKEFEIPKTVFELRQGIMEIQQKFYGINKILALVVRLNNLPS